MNNLPNSTQTPLHVTTLLHSHKQPQKPGTTHALHRAHRIWPNESIKRRRLHATVCRSKTAILSKSLTLQRYRFPGFLSLHQKSSLYKPFSLFARSSRQFSIILAGAQTLSSPISHLSSPFDSMASNEEGEETAPRGNEWEVVSLTQSAYAAAPGPKQVDPNDDNNSSAEYVAETSQAMFMSGHFVFPPSQHENLPLEPDVNEIRDEQGGEDAAPELVADEGGKSDNYEGSTKTKGASAPGSPGSQFINEKGNRLFIGAEFEEDVALQGLSLADKEQSFLGTAKYCSYQSEEPIDLSATTEETNAHAEPVELFYQDLDSGISNLPKAKDEDDDDTSNLPCQAWWKRGAASLVAHAKDANAFWSIFIAAAVMGLVIIGQTWQQERWQVLQTKWQVVHGERIGRMFGPLSRLKDVIVGGDRRGTFIRGSAPAQL